MMNIQRRETEKINLIEEVKKIAIDETLLSTMKLLIKVWNLKYKTMSSYCLKCRKNTESTN